MFYIIMASIYLTNLMVASCSLGAGLHMGQSAADSMDIGWKMRVIKGIHACTRDH